MIRIKTISCMIISVVLTFVLLPLNMYAMAYDYSCDYGLKVGWQTDDKVGITTGNVTFGMMEQLTFSASATPSAQQKDRSLYSVGYQLKSGTTYYSYRPYQWQEAFDANNIQCRYTGQRQNGNGSTAHLSAYDYQMAAPIVAAEGCIFTYRHVGGILRITFLAPSAMTITSLTITAQDATIATATTMNIISQDTEVSDHANSLTLQTENLNVAKDEEVVLYVALPPQDLSSKTIEISVADGSNAMQTIASVIGPDIKAGMLYDITLTDAPSAAKAKAGNTTLLTMPTAVGIANPIARTTDILTDPNFSVQYVSKTVKGDVNGDGVVNTMDAIAIIGYYLNNQTNQVPLSVGDMNGDKLINTMDAIEIISNYLNAK